jgi:hypothetical protein
MANRFKNTPETLYQGNDTTYNVTFDPAGKIGLYLEAGRYHIFKYGYLFAYMDYSLAFKKFKGTEKFTGEYLQEGSTTPFASTEGNGAFKHSYLTGNINLNNVVQLNDYEFWQNSLGLNIDYRIGGASSYSGNTAFQNPNDPAKFMMQLHYRLGYGFKWTDRLFVIPMIETPILSVFSWDNGKSSYEMFSSRYRPLIFTIRFAWLRKSSWDCPPSEGGPNDKAIPTRIPMKNLLTGFGFFCFLLIAPSVFAQKQYPGNTVNISNAVTISKLVYAGVPFSETGIKFPGSDTLSNVKIEIKTTSLDKIEKMKMFLVIQKGILMHFQLNIINNEDAVSFLKKKCMDAYQTPRKKSENKSVSMYTWDTEKNGRRVTTMLITGNHGKKAELVSWVN